MKKFIEFVETHSQLNALKKSIYNDIDTCGWFGTFPKYYRFMQLFEAMRKHYINEYKFAGDLLRISTQDMNDFCQHFVNEYESEKKLRKDLVN